jgi:hypothetical protein
MTNPKKKNDITLDDLARMINKGFEETAKNYNLAFAN